MINLLQKIKYYKANKKWMNDFWAIKEIATLSKREFHWFQLIYQEILMYLKINKKVTPDDLEWLIKRRGFNEVEANYLKEILKYIKLYK